jgi:outer membrane protein OmpA-like peptidoglycan-associated protein
MLILLMSPIIIFGCGTKEDVSKTPEEKEATRMVLFKNVNESLKNADLKAAVLFAPELYADATADLKDATDDFNEGKELAKIEKKLADAQGKFDRATEISNKSGDYFKNTKLARDDAEKVQAPKYGLAAWQEAEKKFKVAIEHLRDGKNEKADAASREAEKLYRIAELNATKAGHLGEIRKEIARLQDLGKKNNAPKILKNAEKLSNSVSDELDRQRYDNENAKKLTEQAFYEVKHASFVNDKIKQMKESDVTYEDLILGQEADLNKIGNELGLKLAYENGFEDSVASIIGAIQKQKNDIIRKDNSIDAKDKNIAELKEKIAAREKQIEAISKKDEEFKMKLKTAEEIERQKTAKEMAQQKKLAEELERQKMTAEELERQKKTVEEALIKEKELQAQRAKKLQSIQTVLTPKEGKVLIDGNNVIVRIYGLTFASGKSAIEPKFFILLSKVKTIIEAYEGCSLVVQGHTDDVGNEKNNKKLSKDRAESVKQYFVANSTITEEKIMSVGFGSDRPVAKNSTKAGRALNRRIDVVITPATN